MDLASLMVDILQLAGLLLVPGFSTVLLLRGPSTVTRVIVYGTSVSILYLIMVSALLLHLGVFTVNALLVTTSAPALLAAARWRHTWPRLKRMQLAAYTLIPSLLVGGSVLLLLLVLTPRWNFLVAPNMDAGNYELYGNHFWKEGSFYLDGRILLDRGALPTWLASHNTWNIDLGSGLGSPSYLPAYPILLGIVKATFDSAVASPLVNALLASLSAMVMVLIGLQLVKARFVVVSIVAGLVATPLFFYYGKQFMSEQLGLLGILLIVHALLESRGLTADPDDEPSLTVATLGLSVGIGFGALSRLDFVPVLVLLVAGLLVLGFDAWFGRGEMMPVSFFVWPAVAGFGAFAVVGGLGAFSYLRHATPDVLEELVSPGIFMLVYGSATAVAILLSGALPVALRRLEQSVPRRSIIKSGEVIAVSLASAWALFVLWSLFVRPVAAGSTSMPGDSENLIRLFSVTSPFLLGAILLLSPLALIFMRPERGVAVMLISGFGFAIYASRHTPPDLWWMRRYLLYIIPLGVVVLAGMIGRLRSRLATNRAPVVATLAAVLTALAVLGAWNMRPLFAAEVNPDVPTRIAQLIREIPTGTLVVVLEGDSIVRGLANSYRSLTGQSVLVDVSLNDLMTATALAEADQEVVILSSAPLPQRLSEAMELNADIDRGTIERQWSNWLDEVFANPRPSQAFDYFIYHCDEHADSQDGTVGG